MKRVLLTGPVERLDAWAAAARSAGWEAIEFPLIRIAELDVRPEALFAASARFEWLCVTSRSALPFVERLAAFSPEIASRAACVGGLGTERLRELGFRTPLAAARDASELARKVAEAAAPGASVLWPRGDRATDFATSLRASGLVVTDPIVYVTHAVAAPTPPRVDAVFFASPSAVGAWCAMPARANAVSLAIAIGETTFEALLGDVAEPFERVVRLAEATPESLAVALAQVGA